MPETNSTIGMRVVSRRGKTLNLDRKRLGVLRTLWLTATFDYQIQNWLSYNSFMISHFDGLL